MIQTKATARDFSLAVRAEGAARPRSTSVIIQTRV